MLVGGTKYCGLICGDLVKIFSSTNALLAPPRARGRPEPSLATAGVYCGYPPSLGMRWATSSRLVSSHPSPLLSLSSPPRSPLSPARMPRSPRASFTWARSGPEEHGALPRHTGARVHFGANLSTPYVGFKIGERLYFASALAAEAFKANTPGRIFLAPHDAPLPPPDGMRGPARHARRDEGVPAHGREKFVVGMPTPRVWIRHGQAVYFCCFGCVSACWADPTSEASVTSERCW